MLVHQRVNLPSFSMVIFSASNLCRQGATHLTRLCRDRVSADVGVGCHSPPAARHNRPQGKERIILDSVYIYIYIIRIHIYIYYTKRSLTVANSMVTSYDKTNQWWMIITKKYQCWWWFSNWSHPPTWSGYRKKKKKNMFGWLIQLDTSHISLVFCSHSHHFPLTMTNADSHILDEMIYHFDSNFPWYISRYFQLILYVPIQKQTNPPREWRHLSEFVALPHVMDDLTEMLNMAIEIVELPMKSMVKFSIVM